MHQKQITKLIEKCTLIGLFCLLFILSSWVHANPTILIMGDSLSAEYGLPRGTGWVRLLEQDLRKNESPWSVFNASISGETSSGGLTRLPSLLQAKKPSIVFLELGGNDTLRGLTIEQTKENLRKMILLSKKSGAKVLLFGMQIPPNYGQQYAKQFKDLYPALASQEAVQLLPFFLEGVAQHKELFQSDNIHPNVDAQPILLKNVWGAMAPYQSLLLRK
ncbi:arylesterase [Polynucleobacter sp. MWH-UH2A]|uniref:arylesterase n=1 Tax=Polynucleobacter sp. MWH-UH2A TaxID=1855617 RepID=UPI001BFE6938|nr:arylesterase [Polynucleobacter sp. MWH-UH2A]QWD63156.1 arylesterase [Polynucleobacter sp. MWH-UH2A]